MQCGVLKGVFLMSGVVFSVCLSVYLSFFLCVCVRACVPAYICVCVILCIYPSMSVCMNGHVDNA